MSETHSGRGQTAAVAVLLIAALSVATVAGLLLAGNSATDDDRTGEEILADASEKYSAADSVVTDAVVTVERGDTARQFEFSAAAAGDGKMRLNLSRDDQYALLGTNGETVWLHDPERAVTAVLDRTDEGISGTLKAGTDEPTGIGLSALPVDPDNIDPDTRLSELLAGTDASIPPQYETALAELPENTTVADLLGERGIDSEANISELVARSDRFSGGFSRLNETAVRGETTLSEQFDAYDFRNKTTTDNWSVDRFTLPGTDHSGEQDVSLAALLERLDSPGLNNSWSVGQDAMARQLFAFDGERSLPSSALEVDRVGTATVDGTDAYELRITGPTDAVDHRLWVAQETDTVLKQQLTSEETTVTVDVVDTRFNVAAADSTFKPPGAMTVAEGSISFVSTPAELADRTAFDLQTPPTAWEFENGLYATADAGPLDAVFPDLPDSATSTYTDGTASLVVTQTGQQYPLPSAVANKTDTVTRDGREIAVYTTSEVSVGRWTTDGTTITIAGSLSRERLISVFEGLDR
jgi:outer membrane lipoprotein-sorting protein